MQVGIVVGWASCLRRPLLVPSVLAFVLVAPSVSAHVDEEGRPPVADVLWFATPSVVWEGRTNFTTHPPEGAGYVQEPETYADRALWTWTTRGVPSEWNLTKGMELRLVVTVSGMEKTWPLPVPAGNATEPFSASFEGDAVFSGGGTDGVLASGEVLVPMDPVHPPEGPLRVEIPMVVSEDRTLGPEHTFAVELHVFARGVKHNSMRVHIMGEEDASHVVVPGFPVAAFRALEDRPSPEICRYYRSHGEPCPERWPLLDTPLSEGPTPTATAEAAGPALGAAMAALATALVLGRRRTRGTVQQRLYGDVRQNGDKA